MLSVLFFRVRPDIPAQSPVVNGSGPSGNIFDAAILRELCCWRWLPLGKTQVRGFAIRKYTCIMTIVNDEYTHELLVATCQPRGA